MFDDDDRKESFLTVLLRQDELGAVVRAQIYIEHVLIEFIASRPDAPKTVGLSFSQLVTLALKLGLPQQFNQPLRAFARIRNLFAHRLDTELTEDLVKEFCHAFSKQMRKMAEGGIDNLVILNTAEKTTREVLTSRGLFMMYSWSLWFALKDVVKSLSPEKNDDDDLGDEDC
jgi:hypothetical protein